MFSSLSTKERWVLKNSKKKKHLEISFNLQTRSFKKVKTDLICKQDTRGRHSRSSPIYLSKNHQLSYLPSTSRRPCNSFSCCRSHPSTFLSTSRSQSNLPISNKTPFHSDWKLVRVNWLEVRFCILHLKTYMLKVYNLYIS